ncbi:MULTISPECIES: DUF5666 domain-containing protein [unclassified Cyanobium]|uniref:DUF5666 domain-containing protein n=1 Tax=unclassified Cyanobium TaxID=2627006 RepID=UPI0020CE0D2F|nr:MULTISPECIES: DUF5666 domain-containing protein [unclassified Cyanobium]MCP9835618.1 hypothetical protein [Cyanobium sp. La Preciosa 7G6]MCP9938384.1 hypothetical protein [Cyanobium sp. Aljojuca 7A6]
MNLRHSALAASLCLGMVSTPALADCLEGRIQSVNPNDRSFVVQGQRFYTDGSTDYEDGLRSFADLKPGLKVEVDHVQRGGRSFAKEVELED